MSNAGPYSLDGFSLLVGRTSGTVVVTVDGELNVAGCDALEGVLTDLIEGQGNLTVEVDLGAAIVEPEALLVFITAARRARRHGAKFILKEPPAHAHEALASADLDDILKIVPRPTSDGQSACS